MPLSDDVLALFAGRDVAELEVILPTGTAVNCDVWAGVEDGALVFFTASETRIRHLERDLGVTLSVTDREHPERSAEVRGIVLRRLEGEEARAVIDRLARKYTGADYFMRTGAAFVVEVERVKATALSA